MHPATTRYFHFVCAPPPSALGRQFLFCSATSAKEPACANQLVYRAHCVQSLPFVRGFRRESCSTTKRRMAAFRQWPTRSWASLRTTEVGGCSSSRAMVFRATCLPPTCKSNTHLPVRVMVLRATSKATFQDSRVMGDSAPTQHNATPTVRGG
jgi:hypothetical protein